MYCVNCGVKLADSEKNCPLCGMKVYHPDITREEGEPLYPVGKYPAQEAHPLGLPILATAIALIPFIIVLVCDLRFSHSVTWSGYVMGGILLVYVSFILPLWFRKRNPVIFVPCAFAAVELYLLYINFATGGKWFLSFAFPICGGVALIATSATALLYYVKKGKLYIFGGVLIALGAMMPLLEFLLYITFDTPRIIGWFFYTLVSVV